MIKSLMLCICLIVFATSSYAASVETALKHTFKNEGGFQIDPKDSGNWTGGRVGSGQLVGTAYGLAGSLYYQYFKNRGKTMRQVTLADTVPVYTANYWKPLRLDAVKSQIVANEVFDAAVNMGVGTEARILQSCINDASYGKPPIKVDGVVGSQTIKRLNEIDQVALYVLLIGERYGRYKFIVTNDPSKRIFFRTWLRRIQANVAGAVFEHYGVGRLK